MHLGIDIDGVLADLAGYVIQRINNKYHTVYTKEDIHEYYQMLEEISLKEEVKQALLDPVFVSSVSMIKNANHVVQELNKTHKIHIITKRPSYTMKETIGWLISNEIPYDSVIISEHENKPIDHIDVLIDDNEDNLKYAISKGKKGILFLQPYNMRSKLIWEGMIRQHVLYTNSWLGVHNIVNYFETLKLET